MSKQYMRPIDDRFQINGVSMPKPHSFKTKGKWTNKGDGTERDINTGNLILNPVCKIYETTWRYKKLIDTQYQMLYNAIFTTSSSNYKNGFTIKTIDSNTLKCISYTTYEQDDFESPEIAYTQNGHRVYHDIEFAFTSMKNDYKQL